MELEPIDIKVLEKLIFEERFENILEECKELAGAKVIEDVLKNLIQHQFVQSREISGSGKKKAGFIYDADFMHDYVYQISSKGLKNIGHFR